MTFLLPLIRLALPVALLLAPVIAHGAITLGGTRLIFTAPSKESSILVRNQSTQDIMIQSWIDPDDASETAQDREMPFAITPALSRLGSNSQQLLRVFYYGKGANQQQESVYWLSVQEIPPKSADENTLQIALRQKIKVFYRPVGLPGSAAEAPKQLQWKINAKGLEVTNPSAFHVSLSSLKLGVGSSTYRVKESMIKPGSTVTLPISGWQGASSSAGTVEFECVNDYGGLDKFTAVTR